MNRIPTRFDRYPAKMVARLADELISKYAKDCARLLDPFCGSGAVLAAGRSKNIPVAGLDVNPYAVLLTKVKLEGFDAAAADELCAKLIVRAQLSQHILPVGWSAKGYWFSEATINKYERIRNVAHEMNLNLTREGRAVLLAYALSVRMCSRADQRSPKPFISKTAVKRRKGRHFNPFKVIPETLGGLAELYGERTRERAKVVCLDLVSAPGVREKVGQCSHIITSPPYINAQDYFRNFKLELFMLGNLIPFTARALADPFIGKERGDLIGCIDAEDLKFHKHLVPQLKKMETSHPRQAEVVHRYLWDMGRSFDSMRNLLHAGGVLVIVCGDNLVGGYAIKTWRVLNRLLENRGFLQFDSFGDDINCRHVPPKRNGHKGLIKQEVISAFRRSPE